MGLRWIGWCTAALVAVPAAAQEKPAGPPDVPAEHWAYSAVRELTRKGILEGYPDGTFGGRRAVTRYEAAAALQRVRQEVTRITNGDPFPRAAPAPGPRGERGPAGEPGP